MTLLLQISDPHFGTERPEVVVALRHHAEALAPDVLVLSGDITQRARRGQFAAAAALFHGLPARLRIAIPGNHDIPLFNLWARWRSPYGNYTRAFGPREGIWRQDGLTFLALDATHPRRHKHGHLPPELLAARLRDARAAAGADGLLVVAAHQPLYTSWGQDRDETLIDRLETAQLLARHRADVILSGHVHVPLIATTDKPFPAFDWRFVLCGAGTAVSQRTRAGVPNSFNTLRIETKSTPSIRITRYDYVNGKFVVMEEGYFRRGPRGWAGSTEGYLPA